MTPSPDKNPAARSARTTSATRVAYCGLLCALALIFSYIEVLIPFNIGVPGVKLGIANLVIIIALYQFNWRYAMGINIIRVLVSGLLFSGMFAALYSLAGAILSMIVMALLKKTGLFSTVGVSIAGGVTHNLGQILVAAALVSNLRMFVYYPVLIFSGVASGAVIGIVAYFVLQKLPDIEK
ncbi:MAG: Gx transporter family protein [Bacillota bacterium]|nr:Gx transporter family protein [Bacillota bacterium]